MKFRSSATLFAKAAPEESVFAQSLEKYFAGAGPGGAGEAVGLVAPPARRLFFPKRERPPCRRAPPMRRTVA
jgi:hypothetical protein